MRTDLFVFWDRHCFIQPTVMLEVRSLDHVKPHPFPSWKKIYGRLQSGQIFYDRISYNRNSIIKKKKKKSIVLMKYFLRQFSFLHINTQGIIKINLFFFTCFNDVNQYIHNDLWYWNSKLIPNHTYRVMAIPKTLGSAFIIRNWLRIQNLFQLYISLTLGLDFVYL